MGETRGKKWTFLSKSSFQGRSLSWPVRSCLQKLIHHKSSFLQMRTLLSETSANDLFSISRVTMISWQPLALKPISDDFVKDLAKCFQCFSFLILCPHHYNYRKIETKCDPTKLIQILNIFYKHGVSCILVIVHRILREYQNWTELKLTHEWSCENKLYLQFIRML